jgi:transposase
VADVARRADVCTSLVDRGRREAQKAEISGFAPVLIEEAVDASSPTAARCSEPGLIVVEVKEARVRICAGASSALISADPEGAAIVIPIPSGSRVWIATGHTDMRRGMQGLALQIQEQLKRDPHAGDLYIFRGRRGDLAKVLWHDGLGLSLYAKRLDRGKFIWPSATEGAVSISAAQMAYMLEGIDWRNPQLTWRPKSAG